MRHAKLFCHVDFGGIDIHANDLVSPHHAGTLNDIEANAAKAKHHDVRARPYFGRPYYGPYPRSHAAANIANLVKGRILADFGDRYFGHDGEVGES